MSKKINQLEPYGSGNAGQEERQLTATRNLKSNLAKEAANNEETGQITGKFILICSHFNFLI
jgi:hypothetical protein